MKNIQDALGSVLGGLSDENYNQSLAFYRHWLEIGQTYSRIPSDLIFDTISAHRAAAPTFHVFISSTACLILRFASDVESDHILAPHSIGL